MPAGLAALLSLNAAHAAEKTDGTASFEYRFTSQPILIDCQADKAAWQSAPVIDRFTLPWRKDNPKARTATRA